MGHPDMSSNHTSSGNVSGKLAQCPCSAAVVSLSWKSQDLVHFPEEEIKQCHQKDAHTTLNLNYNRIREVPSRICDLLPKLEKLYLDGNELSHLPEELQCMVHLEELSVCENKLAHLPESIHALSKLKVLKASANRLKCLPPEIGENLALEVLNVEENCLKRFPPTLGMLSKLRVLDANSNRLEILPSNLNMLVSLEHVNLSKNKLTYIPDSFGKLEKLKQIDFSDNTIKALWSTCESTQMLEKLFLDCNTVVVLPNWFCELEQVTEMCLKCNDISSLPHRFGEKLTHLKLLDLRGNFIEELPDSFCNMSSLETLLLGTHLDYLERSANFMNGNWLTTLPSGFSKLLSLTKLQIEENQLKALPDDIGLLQNLEFLMAGSNMLYDLPKSFTDLKSMKKCHLSKNRLEKLPLNFGDLTELEELLLDSNKLRCLPASMTRLTKLELLDLTENKLKTVPTEIITALKHSLKALNLFFNKFDVPDSEIPHIRKEIHYAERNPEKRDTWRGKNNKPGTAHEAQVQTTEQTDEDRYSSEEDLENSDDDSSVEDDWDLEMNNSSTLSASTEKSYHHVSEDEDNWDNSPRSSSSGSGIEKGQFDLDDETSSKHQKLGSPLLFDVYGNPTRAIDLEISHHRQLPYTSHAPRCPRNSYLPVPPEEGQFDDAVDGDEPS